MPAAKLHDSPEVERISQRMGHEDGPGLALNIRVLELLNLRVKRIGIVVDEHRHEAILDDGRNGRRETGRDGDDLVAGPEAAITQPRAGKGGDGEQVGGGAGVDQHAGFHAQPFGQLPLESFALFAQRQPEIERGGNRSLNFVLSEHAPSVRHRGNSGGEGQPQGIGSVARTVGAVGKPGVGASELQYFSA